MLITDKEELKKYASEWRIWQGIPSIEVTKNGRMFCVFYSGETDETIGNYCVLVKSEDGVNFTEPIAVIYDEGYRCFDPCVWIDPLGRLWFIWAVMPRKGCFGMICDKPDEEELVWGNEFFIGNDIMLNKPTVLSTGEWLFPLAVWDKVRLKLIPTYYDTDATPGSWVYKTVDNGKSFERLGYSQVENRQFDEHMVLEMEDGVLKMFVRTWYGIGVSESFDGGFTWTEGRDSGYGGPLARFHIRRLKSGRILLINHINCVGRTRANLTAMLSEDEGKTWKYQLTIDARNDVSYPDAIEAADGFIYIVHDRERGVGLYHMRDVYACAREVLYSKITEEDIIAGHLVNEKSRLRQVVSKLGKYAGNEKSVFNEMEKYSDVEIAEFLLKRHPNDIIDRVFAFFPRNCMNMHDFDKDRLDELITKLEAETENKLKTVVDIVSLVRSGSSEIKDSEPLVKKIKDVILSNLDQDLSVKEIAEKVGISVYYMQHQFKKNTRLTVIEYKNALKLVQAKRMLVHTKKSMTDIALECGFGSSSYFSEIFQKFEHVSPSEYREMLGIVNE